MTTENEMTFREVLARLGEVETFLKIDPESYSWQSASGLQNKRRQYEQEVVSLREQAKTHLQEVNGAVCFVGDAEQLRAAARKKGMIVEVDAAVPYREIAASVERTLHPGTREWNATQTSAVGTEIMIRMADINPYNRPELMSPTDLRPFVVGHGQDLINATRRIARQIFGDRLVGEYIATSLVSGALQCDLSKEIPQLIVYGVGSLSEAEGLRAFWPFATVLDPKQLKAKPGR